MKKRRPRLLAGDTVQVVDVPVNMKQFRFKQGTIIGVRGKDRTWTVVFRRQEGFALKRHFHVFRRHELKLIKHG